MVTVLPVLLGSVGSNLYGWARRRFVGALGMLKNNSERKGRNSRNVTVVSGRNCVEQRSAWYWDVVGARWAMVEKRKFASIEGKKGDNLDGERQR